MKRRVGGRGSGLGGAGGGGGGGLPGGGGWGPGGGPRGLGGYFGGEGFEGVDRDVDAAFFKGLFDLLDEDAFAVEVGRRDEAGLLHAVAGGADDFELDVVAGVTEGVEGVVGLPEGELRASGADADWVARVVVFAAHVWFLGYGIGGWVCCG